MKELILVRHAKSSWDYPDLRDIERPLGPHGKRDAPYMAGVLAGKGVNPDKLISSPARRAQDTATYFAREFGQEIWDIRLDERIYDAMPDDLQEVVDSLDEGWDTVILFGHNPGFTVFANRFSRGFRFDNVPTCGIVRIKGDVADWMTFRPGEAAVEAWLFPKEYRI